MARRNNQVMSSANAEMPDHVDLVSTDNTIFIKRMEIKEVIENATVALTPINIEKLSRDEETAIALGALKDYFGWDEDFVRDALFMDDYERLKQDFAKQVQMDALREVLTDFIPLFTRDSQGDPQLSDAYRKYITAVETFKTRPGLYPERPDDIGYEKNTYDGRDDPDEPEFIRMWVVPNALIAWPPKRKALTKEEKAEGVEEGERIIKILFSTNNLWDMHRDEDMMSPRTLLTNVKDHMRLQKEWLDYKIIHRTSNKWIQFELAKARDLAVGYDQAHTKITQITTACRVCRSDAKVCRTHQRIVTTLTYAKNRWIRMAEKYISRNGAAFAELEGISRYKRVVKQIKRKSRNRAKTPIGVCWLESWIAGDMVSDLNKRIDGTWAIQVFFDAEARGLIEMDKNGEYVEVS